MLVFLKGKVLQPKHRITSLLAANIFLSGAAFAAMTPYRAIVGVEALGLTNADFGLVMALNAVGSALAAVTLGWISDKVRDRRLLLVLCALAGAVAFGLVWAVRTPLVFIVTFCLLIPFGTSLFSQSFSFSRAYFDREQSGKVEFTMSLLRSLFTVAWIIVPPIAGFVAAKGTAFSVFAFAALAHIGCTLMIGLLWSQPNSRVGLQPATTTAETPAHLPAIRITHSHKMGIAGVTLGLAALQLNMVVLPLIIIRDLGGDFSQVGIVASVAAAIEFPLMIGWGYVAMRIRKELVLATASFVFAIYFGLMVMANGYVQVLLLQAIAAISIAALLGINISYLQESIPGRVGLSTSLVDVTRVFSVWLAAAVFALNTADTYTPLMAIAAGLSLASAILMMLAWRMQRGTGSA